MRKILPSYERLHEDLQYNQYTGIIIWKVANNLANARLSKANTSGYKGVSYNKLMRSWSAYITTNYKTKIIGYYATKEEAALARKNYAIKLRGEFARETLA